MAALAITIAGGRSARIKADVPMSDADDIVIEALLDDVLDPSMVRDAVDVALEICCRRGRLTAIGSSGSMRTSTTLNQERARLAAAIAAGGEPGRLAGRAQDAGRATGVGWRRDRATVAAQAPLRAADACTDAIGGVGAGELVASGAGRRCDPRAADRDGAAEGARNDRAARDEAAPLDPAW